MWQTGSIGRISGCSEDVDTNILFKSKYPEVFGGSKEPNAASEPAADYGSGDESVG